MVKRKMTLIPFTFVLLRLPDFLYRLLEYRTDPEGDWESKSTAAVALSWAMAVCNPSQGWVNAVRVLLLPLARVLLLPLARVLPLTLLLLYNCH
jgi:hypothetical protein